MRNEPVQNQVDDTYKAPRTGPVGRAARVALAAVLGWAAYDLWVDRVFIFAGTDPVSDPGLWLLTALLLHGLYNTAQVLAGWGKRALAALAALAIASAGAALTTAGTIWTVPLTWLVWGFDVVGVILVAIALLVAVGTGTPGCEIGVVRELIRRRRGQPDDRPVFCLAGLRAIDSWERRMPWHLWWVRGR